MNEPANHEAVFDTAGNTHVRIDEAPKGRGACWYHINRAGRVEDWSGPWPFDLSARFTPATPAQAAQAVRKVLAAIKEARSR